MSDEHALPYPGPIPEGHIERLASDPARWAHTLESVEAFDEQLAAAESEMVTTLKTTSNPQFALGVLHDAVKAAFRATLPAKMPDSVADWAAEHFAQGYVCRASRAIRSQSRRGPQTPST